MIYIAQSIQCQIEKNVLVKLDGITERRYNQLENCVE